MRITETIQNLVKAQIALDNLNIGEARSRLTDAIGDLNHPALRFITIDESGWFAANREYKESIEKEVLQNCKKEFDARVAQKVAQLMIPFQSDKELYEAEIASLTAKLGKVV